MTNSKLNPIDIFNDRAPDADYTKTCPDCQQVFEVDKSAVALVVRFIRYCPSCSQKRKDKCDAEEKETARLKHEERWGNICPPLYRDTDVEKLPSQDAMRKVMAWQYGPKGLTMFGPTRKGKSRCAWLLLRREFDKGRSIRVLDSLSGIKYASKFNQSAEDALEWVTSMIECDIVFADDVFKSNLSPSFESALFTIVNQRSEYKRPIIATINDTGASLAARMTSDRGEPTVSRIREFSDAISFK